LHFAVAFVGSVLTAVVRAGLAGGVVLGAGATVAAEAVAVLRDSLTSDATTSLVAFSAAFVDFLNFAGFAADLASLASVFALASFAFASIFADLDTDFDAFAVFLATPP